jgi:hypothetical protein
MRSRESGWRFAFQTARDDAKVKGRQGERPWFQTTLILSSARIAAFAFEVWKLVESRFFR